MTYPRRLLNEHEEISLDLHPHWWYFSKNILTGIPLFAFLVLVIVVLEGSVRDVALWVWVVLTVVWAGWLGWQYLEWRANQFVVTNQRVVYRSGVLSKQGVEIPLERINNINFSQKLFERLIGAGDLQIESAGAEGRSHFEDVQSPDSVAQEINRQRRENAREQAAWATGAPVPGGPPPAPAGAAAGAAPGAVAGTPSVADQIAQLADLRDRGALTDAEFEAQKARLLGGP